MLAQKEAIEMDRMSNAADEKHEQYPELQGDESQQTSTQFHSRSRSSSLENKHSQHTLLPRKHSRHITRVVSRSHMKHIPFITAARAVTAALQCLVTADLSITDSQRHRLTYHTSLAFIMVTQKLLRTDTLAFNSHPFTWLRQA